MSYNIEGTNQFEKEFKKLAKKYPSLKSDIANLIVSIQVHPTQGIEILKNCFKIRFTIKSKGRGKSGGARLITFVQIQEKRVLLLTLYDKSERETVQDHVLRSILENHIITHKI